MSRPLVVGISGASGVVYGIEMLKTLKSLDLPAHLILTRTAAHNVRLETDYTVEEVRSLASKVYEEDDLAASVSSGSFQTRGMIVVPCSIKTLSGVANSFGYNLMIRCADVTLKERRPLILMVRETPLHRGHLELMTRATDMGAIILPPVPAFYHRPASIGDLIRQTIGKALDLLDIEHDLYRRWTSTSQD